jgi:PAS domain S-box-containing protein
MVVLDQERVDILKKHLRWNPRGLTISDLASKMDLNRNLVAKYLDMLLVSGQVEMEVLGTAKVYFLSHRVPISAMLEFSSDYVIMLDSEQRVIQVNEPVLKLLDEKRESLVGKKTEEINNPFFRSIPSIEPYNNDQNASNKITETTSVLNGETYHFRVKQVSTAFEDGGKGVTLIIEDITAKKTFEETLQLSESRYRGIVEDQTEFITRFRPEGTILFVNESYVRYLRSINIISDLSRIRYIPGIIEEDFTNLCQSLRSLDAEHATMSMECRVADPSGRIYWNSWTIRALFNDEGFVQEFQGVGRDSTETKEAATKINNYIKMIEFLAQTSKTLMDMGGDDDLYDYVARQVYSLAPGFLVWVSILDEQKQILTVKGVAGNPVDIERLHQITGRSLMDMTFPIEDYEMAELIQKRKLVKTPPLHRLFHLQVPEEICRQIEEAAGGIDCYLMGLVSKGRIVGDVGISLKGGSELANRELIEAFISKAEIALDRKIAEDSLKEKEAEAVRSMEFLNRTAIAFIEMEEDKDIYPFIGEQVYSLVPDSIVAVCSFDPDERVLMLRSVKGKEEEVAWMRKELGDHIGLFSGLTFPVDVCPDAIPLFQKHSLDLCPPLYDLLFHTVPEDVCIRIEDHLSLGKGYAMGFICRGGIFGNVIIKLKKGAVLKNHQIIEPFISQAAVSLLRKHARSQLRQSEERNIRNMEFLSKTAIALVNIRDDENICHFITDQIHLFNPDLIVGFNSFDMERGTATLRSISGLDECTAGKLQEFGVDLFGFSFPLVNNPAVKEIASQKCLTPGPERLYNLLFRMVPENTCDRIEKMVNWGGCYAMGCLYQGEIFGSVVIIVKNGKNLENKETIEAFINQVSVALLRNRIRVPLSVFQHQVTSSK